MEIQSLLKEQILLLCVTQFLLEPPQHKKGGVQYFKD